MLTDFMLRSPFDELWALANGFPPMSIRQPWVVPATHDLLRSSDVVSDEDGWRIRVALPGISPENVHVDVAANRLRIRASEQEGHGEVIRYERELSVPDSVDTEQITATCRNGLLELRLPLKDAVRPRRIAVTAVEPKQLKA
jgi:HSP20 family protein